MKLVCQLPVWSMMLLLCLPGSKGITKMERHPENKLPTTATQPGFYVKGRFLYDPCGTKITLRGVNKMNFWTDRSGRSFPEIAKTGANCVRIVWKALEDNGQPTKAADLDKLITACVAQKMIPMVEIHDATGKWNLLGQMVNFWKRADIVAIVQKHQKYLLLNIANECGNDQVTDAQFTKGYSGAVQQLRQAGIHTPLVIDGADFGKNLEQLVRTGQGVVQADPDKNLLFSVHTYWPVALGATPQFIKEQFQRAADAGLPFIVGEFAEYGAYADGESICGPKGRVDYQTIVAEAQRLDIGWLAWEWGPGNVGGGDSLCVVMDMTAAGTFTTLKGWGKEVTLTNAASIRKTAVRSPFLTSNQVCN